MANGFSVDTDQLRAHASHVAALAARFQAVKAASAHIMQDEQAYGLLCGWIARVLEGRHVQADELIGMAEQNLSTVAAELRRSADEHEQEDAAIAQMIEASGAT